MGGMNDFRLPIFDFRLHGRDLAECLERGRLLEAFLNGIGRYTNYASDHDDHDDGLMARAGPSRARSVVGPAAFVYRPSSFCPIPA